MAITVNLPKKKTKPVSDFGRYRILIFGERKIGKTTLCSHLPDALFLPTEEGIKDLKVYTSVDEDDNPILLDSWPLFKAWCLAFRKTDRFKTAVIDTVDGAYDLCEDWCCKELKIESPNDLNWGEAWTYIYRQFKSVFRPLFNCGKGVVMLSHSKSKSIERWDRDDALDQLQCSVTGKCGSYLTGAVDIWAYYGYKGSKRRLYLLGNEQLDAGNRLENHLLTPEGEKLPYLPLGNSSKEAYDNLMLAWDNKISLGKSEKKKRKKKGKKK